MKIKKEKSDAAAYQTNSETGWLEAILGLNMCTESISLLARRSGTSVS